MKNEPVLIIMSVLAGLQIITTGSALADVIGAQPAALIVLVVGGVQVAMQFYVRGQVTANENVVARVDNTRHEVVAGKAAQGYSNVRVGEPVAVVPPGV